MWLWALKPLHLQGSFDSKEILVSSLRLGAPWLFLAGTLRSKSFSQNHCLVILNYITNYDTLLNTPSVALFAFVSYHHDLFSKWSRYYGRALILWDGRTELPLCHFSRASVALFYSRRTSISLKPNLVALALSVHLALLPSTLTSKYGASSVHMTTNRTLISLSLQSREPVEDWGHLGKPYRLLVKGIGILRIFPPDPYVQEPDPCVQEPGSISKARMHLCSLQGKESTSSPQWVELWLRYHTIISRNCLMCKRIFTDDHNWTVGPEMR